MGGMKYELGVGRSRIVYANGLSSIFIYDGRICRRWSCQWTQFAKVADSYTRSFDLFVARSLFDFSGCRNFQVFERRIECCFLVVLVAHCRLGNPFDVHYQDIVVHQLAGI